MALCLATWTFGLAAISRNIDKLKEGMKAQEAVVNIVSDVEEDPQTGVFVVGRGGFPNKQGVLQCDAAIMDGHTHSFGAVGALEGVGCAIRVACRIKDGCPHNMLVGQGAQEFARDQGFKIEPDIEITPLPSNYDSLNKMPGTAIHSQHDTLGVIVMDNAGNLACGVSTSGKPGKLAGRVGDSPLPGSGLYVDNEVGAACCTGDGDEIMRFCPAYQIVEYMRQGLSPTEACQETLKRIIKKIGNENMFEFAMIAVNTKGQYGAAGNLTEWTDTLTLKTYTGFPYVKWTSSDPVPVLESVMAV